MAANKVLLSDETAVAANSKNANVFKDSAFGRAPFPGFVTVYATGSAAGLEGQLLIGGELVIERQALNTNNRIPIVPDDYLIGEIPVFEGQLIQWSVFNTTAGALTPRTRIEIERGQLSY